MDKMRRHARLVGLGLVINLAVSSALAVLYWYEGMLWAAVVMGLCAVALGIALATRLWRLQLMLAEALDGWKKSAQDVETLHNAIIVSRTKVQNLKEWLDEQPAPPGGSIQ